MASNEFIIEGDRYSGKNLLLNLYLLTNLKSKFSDEDVKNLHLFNINTVKDLHNFFRNNICLANFFICLINDKGKKKKDKKGDEHELFDVLIRFKSITFLDNIMDLNFSLTILGDINPEIGIVNVKNIFLTAMEKEKQEYETFARNVILEVADNFNIHEAKIRTILGSDVMKNMKFLTSTFQEEKDEWLEYLRFQSQDLEFKRNNSCLYIERKLNEYIKIPKSVVAMAKFHEQKLSANHFWYVDKKIFLNNNLKFGLNFDEVIVVELILLLENEQKLSILKSLSNVSVAPLLLNRLYQKESLSSLLSFNFNENFVQDTKDIFNLGLYIPDNSLEINQNNFFKKLEAIYHLENNIKDENLLQGELNVLKKTMTDYHIINCYYEIKNEDDFTIEQLMKEFPQYGYLAYIGKGDSTLIRRSSVILDKISKNDVANPYLTNYIFNIKDIKLEGQTNKLAHQNLNFASNNLNTRQKTALVKALNSRDIFLLQGPPGTGKTEFIAELVYQYAKIGKKILVSSQNHIAIDNVLSRLSQTPLLTPLRLTGEEVRKKNRFNDFNPDRLIFNHYRFIYSYLLRQYVNKWNALDYDYDNQKQELQKLKANAKMLGKEILDYNTYSEKLNQLVKLKEQLHNQVVEGNVRSRSLVFDINNLNNLLEFLQEITWSGIISTTPDLVNIFNKNFGEIIKEKFGFNFDESYSILEVYKRLILSGDTIKIKEKENEIMEWKIKEPWDEPWIHHYDKLNSELNELRGQMSLKQNTTIYNNMVTAFQKDINTLLKKYNDEILTIKSKVSTINLLKYDQEISYLEIEVEGLHKKVATLKIEVANIVENVNHIFNLHLSIKDITTTINDIDHTINDIDYTINNIKNEKSSKDVFVNNMLKFLDRNYKMSDFLNLQKLDLQKFSGAMEKDTIEYANEFLHNNVNVVAMTATSNQTYAQSKNKILQEYNISDIDIKRFGFDVVIIDEVSKLTPMEIFMPLVYGKSVVLVGDYRQLPPIMPYREEDLERINRINNENYSYSNFSELVTNSMFKKLISRCDDSVKEILTGQYRSHEDIMQIVNVFYENQLQLGDPLNQNNEKQHYVTSFNKNGLKIFDPQKAIYWIDSTKDFDNTTIVYEQGEPGSTSLFNGLEIELTVKALRLLDQGYENMTVKLNKQPKVGVISFYGLHVKKMRKIINNMKFKNIKVEVATVDDYQGRETDIIIVNTIRNPRNQLLANKEFVKKYERLNVAFSRAKNMLIIIGAINFFSNIDVEIPSVANPNITRTIKAYYEIIRIIETRGNIWRAIDILD